MRKYVEIEVLEAQPPDAYNFPSSLPLGLSYITSTRMLFINSGSGPPCSWGVQGMELQIHSHIPGGGGLGLHLSEEMAVKFYSCAFGKPMP